MKTILVNGVATQVSDDQFAAEFPPPAATAPVVPASVSALAAKLALEHAGLLTQVEAFVQADGGDLQVWFDEAEHWQRNDPHVLSTATAMNLTSAQVDNLFQAAGAIDAATS